MAVAFRQEKSASTAVSGNTVAVTVTTFGTTLANSLIIIVTSSKTANITGISDGTANTYTQASGAQSSNGAVVRGDVWYCLSAPNTASTFTATLDQTNTNERTIFIVEVTGFTAATFDVSNVVNNGTSDGASTDTGASVTTTSTNGFIIGLCGTTNGIPVGGNPKSGNEFTGGSALIDSVSSKAIAYLISNTAAAHFPEWTDSASGVAFCASTVAFKEGGGGGGGTPIAGLGRRMQGVIHFQG